MTDKKKPRPKKARADQYDDKLKVKGSFLDIVKAAVKHADNPKKK